MVNIDYARKMKRCHDYVEALEEEKRKIQVFQRELPLCLELVSQAIDACRKELSGSTTTEHVQQSECSEHGPVLEEFIPIKKCFGYDEDEEQESQEQKNNSSRKREKNGDKKKSDWLRSVQLWNNQSPDPPSKEDAARDVGVVEVRKNGGAFQPFQKEKNEEKISAVVVPTVGKPAVSTTSSTTEKGTKLSSENAKKEDKEAQDQRKQRRCWSPELHRRFLQALQQLGGSHVATPKQIRDLMKVDGLTNDEVKSHLQKYRLHTRRPSQSAHNNGNQQAPQFVVVGGIWMPPPEYATLAVTTAPGDTASVPATQVYTPVPSVPQTASKPVAKRPQQYDQDRGSHSEGGTVNSNSPAASSSSTHSNHNSPMS